MYHTHMHRLVGLAALALVAGCSGGDDSQDRGPLSDTQESTFNLLVAPQEADSRADFACYDILVSDADGNAVWSIENACSNTWSIGLDGTFSLVGVCDASGGGQNTVSVRLTRLVSVDGTELGNWDPDDPPTFETDFTCTANADALVRAEFTVITQGQVGFLNVQVEVQEIA